MPITQEQARKHVDRLVTLAGSPGADFGVKPAKIREEMNKALQRCRDQAHATATTQALMEECRWLPTPAEILAVADRLMPAPATLEWQPPPPEHFDCVLCSDSGMHEHEGRWAFCGCPAGLQRQQEDRGAVEAQNAVVERLRATCGGKVPAMRPWTGERHKSEQVRHVREILAGIGGGE